MIKPNTTRDINSQLVLRTRWELISLVVFGIIITEIMGSCYYYNATRVTHEVIAFLYGIKALYPGNTTDQSIYNDRHCSFSLGAVPTTQTAFRLAPNYSNFVHLQTLSLTLNYHLKRPTHLFYCEKVHSNIKSSITLELIELYTSSVQYISFEFCLQNTCF